MKQAINIIFDGPPSHESGRFVEVETDDGGSINAGKWIERTDGLWALRITELPVQPNQEPDCPDCEFWEHKNFCPYCGKALRVEGYI